MTRDEHTGLYYQKVILKQCKVYISGKITGYPKAEKEFAEAEKKLTAAGLTAVNPFRFNHDHDESWESYMRVCIIELCKCNTIYMLPNWKDSRGAKIEYKLAKKLGMHVLKDVSKSLLNDINYMEAMMDEKR
jgi:hypothetical protein